MSKQTFEEAFIPSDQRYKNEVMQATWGHLAPEKGKKYKGKVVFGVDCFGGNSVFVLSCYFEGLDSSPWFFESLQDFLYDQDASEGKLYEFKGVFYNYEFRGEVEEIFDIS